MRTRRHVQVMLAVGGGGRVDKLLFSQGRAQRTQSCGATLMQSSETLFAFGVPSPPKHAPGSQQTARLTCQIDPRSQSLPDAFCDARRCRCKAQRLAADLGPFIRLLSMMPFVRNTRRYQRTSPRVCSKLRSSATLIIFKTLAILNSFWYQSTPTLLCFLFN